MRRGCNAVPHAAARNRDATCTAGLAAIPNTWRRRVAKHGSLQPGISWRVCFFSAAADDSLSEDDKRILHWLYRQRELRPETPKP